MNSLNSILLEGNLTRNPEAKSTPKGTPVCSFSVASNRWFRSGSEKQQEVSYFDIEAWSGLAERCSTELEKGRGVRIVGRLKQDRWLDQDGKTHSHVKIVAEHVDFKPQFNRAENDDESDDEGIDPLEREEQDLMDTAPNKPAVSAVRPRMSAARRPTVQEKSIEMIL